ncbi:MAG: peptidoglycan editing factor PgeF [Desulfobacterales bacterium]|nr:peptidoglycan editing factor PgeF [Desulfobacterales bacterium]
MVLKEKNGIPFFHFPNLAEFSGIQHGIFTRKGGNSSKPFSSLNVTLGLGDSEAAVRQNRSEISQAMGGKELVFASQVHGTKVLVLSNNNNPGWKTGTKNPGDAIVTNIPMKPLVIQVADCQAVLMYDPVRQVIANVHSGWRGSINNIIGAAADVMIKKFDCNPSDIVAGIGPSLGPCCAEFVNYEKEIPEKFWKYKNSSDHFDFWWVSKDQLCNAGVLAENIYSGNMCTKCNTDLFFSYRGEGVTGRFAVVAGLT